MNEHARVIQFPFLPLTGMRPFTRYARAYNIHVYKYIRLQGNFVNVRRLIFFENHKGF